MKSELVGEVKRHVESLTITNKDVVLLRGNWDTEMIQEMLEQLNALGIFTLLIVLPTYEMDFSKMGIADFYDMLKECEQRLGLNEKLHDDGVTGDKNV